MEPGGGVERGGGASGQRRPSRVRPLGKNRRACSGGRSAARPPVADAHRSTRRGHGGDRGRRAEGSRGQPVSSPQESIASAHERAGERSRLRVGIVLTAFILVLEAAGGLYSNSLALLSDAGHVMTDRAGLLLCYAALALALRPATARKTYGWYRIEILAALVNGALLFALAVGIFLESVRRLQHPPTVLTLPMMLTAGLGLVVNVAAMTVLLRGRSNINLRGALIHVFGDTLSSVGVLLTGALIMATGWTGADAVMGMLIGVIIVVGALRLLRDAVDVLLEATPAGIELIRVADAISE